MLVGIAEIDNLHVYTYTFLDDHTAIITPERLFEIMAHYMEGSEICDYFWRIKKLFLSKGWEGDGALGLIWLPPFVDVGIEDTHGNYIWHVKQSNNGISWLASDFELNFSRLDSRN